jgi:hypothetical protein
MKRKALLLLILSATPFLVGAQEKENNDLTIKLGGFIKNDFFYDTRQTVAAREGHFLLWPAKPSLDRENQDINDASSFNFLSIQTRLNLTIAAPVAFGVKTTGHIEGAFFGHSNPDINGFRLRHAFIKFEWENSEVLLGQSWNPLFVTASFPDVVSFNTGCPFQAFSRNPQIRFTKTAGRFKFIVAALSQRDFANVGPQGTSSSYLRNAAMPDMHVQAHYSIGNPNAGPQFIFGGGAAYKKIVPELVTAQNYKTNAAVEGITYMGFARAVFRPVTVKAQYLMGQNVNDLLMIGGYGISQITDQAKGMVEYAPLRTNAFWLDLHTNGQAVQLGVFLGMSENLGATKDLVAGSGTIGLGTDIQSLYRVSPRLIFNSGKARFALECEYTSARFGAVNTTENSKGIPVNAQAVSNLRLLLGAYLFI